MKILHMGGFNESELIQYRNAVRGNLIDAMSSVLRDMENLEIVFEYNVNHNFLLNPITRLYKKWFRTKKFLELTFLSPTRTVVSYLVSILNLQFNFEHFNKVSV